MPSSCACFRIDTIPKPVGLGSTTAVRPAHVPASSHASPGSVPGGRNGKH